MIPFRRRKPTPEPTEWASTAANLPERNSADIATWGTLQAAYGQDTAQQRVNAPIKRTRCLAVDWQPGDILPAVCALPPDHASDHRASGSDRPTTWANEQEDVA